MCFVCCVKSYLCLHTHTALLAYTHTLVGSHTYTALLAHSYSLAYTHPNLAHSHSHTKIITYKVVLSFKFSKLY